jgi:hypothetical protein
MEPHASTVPDLALEQYRLNELPPREKARIAKLLETDVALRGRLAWLIQSDDEIAREYPAAWLAPQIRARAAERASTGPARTAVFGWIWPAALGTAVLLLLVTIPGPTSGPGLSNSTLSTDGNRPKGIGPALTIYRHTDRGSETMADGAVARPGDLLRVGYGAAERDYGVILSIDGRGTVTMHLPRNGRRAALLGHGRLNLLDEAYELDDAPGWERFYFVTADAAFDVAPIAQAARRAAGADLRSPPGLLPLSREFTQSMFLLQKEARP